MSVKGLLPKSLTRRSTFLVIVVSLLIIGVGTAVLMQRDLNTEPAQKKYISATSSLTIDFSDTMDHSSVESKADIRGMQVRSSSWSGNVWKIEPQKSLDIGDTIEVVIPADTLKANGQSLGVEQVYAFVVSLAPSVSAILPTPGSVDVPVDAELTIVFDRPMVPLSLKSTVLRCKCYDNTVRKRCLALDGDIDSDISSLETTTQSYQIYCSGTCRDQDSVR